MIIRERKLQAGVERTSRAMVSKTPVCCRSIALLVKRKGGGEGKAPKRFFVNKLNQKYL